MFESNLERFHRWFEEVWNQRREETIDELLSPAAKAYGMGLTPVVGPDGFKPVWRAFLSTFESLTIKVEGAIASDEFVAGHLTVTGRHVGDDIGIPASGMPVSFVAHTFSRWENGQIVEGWNLIDAAALYRQAGLI